jgi:TetR/AcrR family transcriptional repressor of nem operon
MAVQKITKEDIIRKSLKIFSLKGYTDTSIADLAEVCGITNANFYYYFKNKEGLMGEVLGYVYRLTLEKFRILLEDTTTTAHEKLNKVSQFIEKLYINNPGGCIMGNTALEIAGKSALNAVLNAGNLILPDFLQIVKRFFEEWVGCLIQLLLSKYQETKARELAEGAVQDIEGGIMLMKLYQDKKYLLNALRRLEKLLD